MQEASANRADRIAELLSFLREHPHDNFSAGELSERFGVEREFVATLLTGIRLGAQPHKKNRKSAEPQLHRLQDWFAKSLRTQPLLYIVLSTLVYAGLAAGASYLDRSQSTFQTASQVLLFAALVGAHGALYFRSAAPLLPSKGAAIIFAPLAATLVGAILMHPSKAEMSVQIQIAVGLFGLVFLAIFYSIGFGLVGVWGAFYKQKKEDAALTRQQLLQRYFELNERLKHSAGQYVSRPSRIRALVDSYRANPYMWGLFLGLFFALLSVGASAYSGINPYNPNMSGQVPAKFLLLILPLSLLSIGTFFFISYLAGGPKKAALVAFIFGAANDLGHFFISRGRSVQGTITITNGSKIYHPSPWVDFVIGLIGQMGFAAAIGAASTLGERKLREKKLLAGDEAILASELLGVQMRLLEQSSKVAVMVVDAVGSTKMKANVDTLTAEYAFRLYQQWIARITSLYRGTVHSTAGDGAILAFASADDALSCAIELQRDIGRFNREENKLPSAFRVRIGLHVGEVATDVREVQFTRVIDIAAHIEKVAPIGGVALSEELVSLSSAIPVRERGDEVDGSRIYTVDPEAIEQVAQREG